MKAGKLYLFMLGDFWGFITASFHNDFTDIRRHTDLLLEWDHADATAYPLVIHVRVLNTTSDSKVNIFETNISIGLIDDSFLWIDLPSPLPFLATATYEVQVLPQKEIGNILSGLIIASSTPFFILPESEDEDGSDGSGWQITINGTASQPPGSANSSHSDGRHNKSTAIATGLVVPFVVGVSVFVLLRMQRRRKRTLEERRKERETLVIE
ncbi:hypothetical protein F5Y09DRAFT_351102 [Xylaria sp. FL1042]|nr:hypothetical protein F5Y09DRAFT_351102 [Xylaria sp. FL1042]